MSSLTLRTARLRLPSTVEACLFDLDGVLTDTAGLHAEAWKRVFDEFLRGRPERFVPFDLEHDYLEFVDGKERSDGVRAFLETRNIVLPEGSPDDPPSAETVHGIGNRKNALVLELFASRGVLPFADALALVALLRDRRIATAVVSASANCLDILEAARLHDRFDAVVDARVAAKLGLRGKPQPDTFLEAARRLGVGPRHAAVFEDAIAGIEAGRAGGFVPVVGVARRVPPEVLRAHGADVAVARLTELIER